MLRTSIARAGKIYARVPEYTEPLGYQTLILAIQADVEALGYTLTSDLAAHLELYGLGELMHVRSSLLASLAEITGDTRHRPLYPGFPDQVRELPMETLVTVAAMHYLGDWIGLRIIPDFPDIKRRPLDEKIELKPIDLGDPDQFWDDVGLPLLSARSSWSDQDRADVSWLVGEFFGEIAAGDAALPDEMPIRENVATLVSAFMRVPVGPDDAKAFTDLSKRLSRYVKHANDVLRLAAALSDGDVSLADATRFKSFSKRERRFLLELLNNVEHPKAIEDMQGRHAERWKRLGERLHPGDYKARYPRAFTAFDAIRRDDRVESFNGKVERAMAKGFLIDAAELLRSRPADFARRLDALLRRAGSVSEAGKVIDRFDDVAHQDSSTALMQALAHFQARREIRTGDSAFRFFAPKGRLSRLNVVKDTRPDIDPLICDEAIVSLESALVARFLRKGALGKAFVDRKALANYAVPLQQRSASRSMRTVARGSRLPLGDKDTVRLFLYWRDLDGVDSWEARVDIDLSVVFYDADWTFVDHCSYTQLRGECVDVVHSGDLTSAPDGAAEYIDFRLSQCDPKRARSPRYAVMTVLSYTQQLFADLPECAAGWMMREAPGSGEIFEPATVQNRIDVASASKACVPMIVNLATREALWTDIALKRVPDMVNNIERNQRGLIAIGQAMSSLRRPDLATLFDLHIRARGQEVFSREEADIVFALDGDVTPFDHATILADYL